MCNIDCTGPLSVKPVRNNFCWLSLFLRNSTGLVVPGEGKHPRRKSITSVLRLLPKLRMSGAVPLYVVRAWTRTVVYFLNMTPSVTRTAHRQMVVRRWNAAAVALIKVLNWHLRQGCREKSSKPSATIACLWAGIRTLDILNVKREHDWRLALRR